jgi:hypothetical protein
MHGSGTVEGYIRHPLPHEFCRPVVVSCELEGATMTDRIPWSGVITAVQPRIRLTRSFDERSHTYLGYLLRIQGTIGTTSGEFRIAVGQGAHAQHEFRIGDSLAGLGDRVADPRLEIADLYRVSKLKLMARGEPGTATSPWHGVPPPMAVYRERGHRRLAATTYESQCSSCIWGCAMAVEMIIDQWKPDRRRYRTETFCYGPLSCSKYRPGPTRKVPGRSGMTYEEQDWVDQDATSHRGPVE